MDTLEQIRQQIHEKVGTPLESITAEASLESVGIDSLMLLDLMFDFEDHFKIKLPNDLPRPQTVGELVQVVESLSPKNA
ncbi:MAG TPA: acyl carrier protein [Rhodocyclaceae bacterium]|nr:acyl carrier protein [Rhodocyclaceae bacterium]